MQTQNMGLAGMLGKVKLLRDSLGREKREYLNLRAGNENFRFGFPGAAARHVQ